MRFKIFIFFVSIIMFCFSANCETKEKAQALFYKGNDGYAQGMFDEAILNYEAALSLNFESGNLYYNLGNAYLKKGELGKSILNYIRAKRFIPYDADLNSNLNYARSLIESKPIIIEKSFFKKLIHNLKAGVSLDLGIFILSISYFLLSGVIVMLIVSKKPKRTFVVLSWVLFVFISLWGFLVVSEFRESLSENEAVIIANQVDVRFEPFIDATVFFNLYEGSNVNVVDYKEDWVKIKRADGKQGWIKKIGLELI